ncbi:dihydropteroate synthase [Hoylesella nanceiensis]|uniref:dihydropteroate synthase n=1 Tax=Hoylesella nanceiensis TaxID=425941 RepID=UPI001C601E5B|nr:dihydropteroate synthase [Hoylesella nanceiensis]MBW4766777.1 dihydropteroate synthase [Hoylesella nanceiensis]
MTKILNIRGQLFDFSTPVVMGILNLTPDSFYANSRVEANKNLIQRAEEMLQAGATILDIGAFSTRPGAEEVSEKEEMQRLKAGLLLLKKELPNALLSVDTYRSNVAKMCVEEFGVDIINDVSEGGITGRANVLLEEEQQMFKTVAQLKVPYILMSVKSDIVSMIKSFVAELNELHALGVKDVILDPGFGFGKDLKQNYEVLYHLEKLSVLDAPVLVGASRKRMIQQPLNVDATHSLNGTTVVHTLALMKGASILRVHDVQEAVEAIQIVEQYKQASSLLTL